VRFQRRRENEIIRLPFSSGFISICRSASDSDQRFARKSVDRFAPSAVLDREQPELMKIKPARVWCWLERVSILGGRLKEPNRNQECSRQGEVEMSHASSLSEGGGSDKPTIIP